MAEDDSPESIKIQLAIIQPVFDQAQE